MRAEWHSLNLFYAVYKLNFRGLVKRFFERKSTEKDFAKTPCFYAETGEKYALGNDEACLGKIDSEVSVPRSRKGDVCYSKSSGKVHKNGVLGTW